MISLCMDSAYKNLILGVYKDKELLAGVSIEAFKKQSETIFVELNRILEEEFKTAKELTGGDLRRLRRKEYVNMRDGCAMDTPVNVERL